MSAAEKCTWINGGGDGDCDGVMVTVLTLGAVEAVGTAAGVGAETGASV